MNLTVAELAELPLAAALFDGREIVARTPEWRDAAPGAVGYRVRRNRLVVSTDETHPMCAPVLDQLLDEIDITASSLPRRQALRVTMLAASLRIVAGRAVSGSGTSADVLEHACAGIASRTALQVSLEEEERFAVQAPAVAALVLVQFATNAERHDHAESVVLRAAASSFGGHGRPRRALRGPPRRGAGPSGSGGAWDSPGSRPTPSVACSAHRCWTASGLATL